MDTRNATRFINNHVVPLVPNYSFEFSFEREFKPAEQLKWMETHWVDSIYWCSAYVLLIFCGKALMANREPFKLRGLLFVWNVALAVFSLMGAGRALPEMAYGLYHFGFKYTVCNAEVLLNSRVIGLWAWLFTFSKLIELGDTLFIILRKQKLLFLHWYHHITVFIYCWYSFPHVFGPARWYYAMNFSIHGLMYSYYALRSIGIRLPRSLAMGITSLQILQMIVGLLITLYAHLSIGNNCPNVYPNLTISGLLMYGSYMLLFCQFFLRVYLRSEKRKSFKADRLSIDENANLVRDKKSN